MVEILNSPLGAAVLVVVALVVQSFGPAWLKPVAAAVLRRVKGSETDGPRVVETETVPVEPKAPEPERPVIELGKRVLGELARRRFPAALTEADAVERYLIEEASLSYYRADADRELPRGEGPPQA